MNDKFIRLIWTCPNCGARNPGPQRACGQCGAPQPPDVQFELPAEAEMVTDEAEMEAARRGADIHCTYCGTRNAAGTSYCTQCGADLGEGQVRRSGEELSPTVQATQVCPACASENVGQARFCRQCGAPLGQKTVAPSKPATTERRKPRITLWLFAALGLFLLCIGALWVFVLSPAQQVEGVVTNVHWQTVVVVEQLQPVRYTNESGSPPSDAYDISCYNETKQVCREKTVDLGNGYAQVVEECHDEVEQYCSYTRDEWKDVQSYTLEGSDLSPRYAQPALSSKQRLGTSKSILQVYLNTPQGEKVYTPEDLDEFRQFTPGSRWLLSLNRLGTVLTLEPLR
ncbi:MAG: zinc ribbon domain-containing protein [Anaerolineales bacterium]